MNVREHFIGLMLEKMREVKPSKSYNIIEIGTMFQTVEGRSTYIIAKFIKDHDLDARFVSIDLDQDHIDKSRSIISEYDENLLDLVEFRRGYGTEILESILPEMEQVHFALLDGGAQPEFCLKEFEMVGARLPPDCACLVDDLGALAPTKHYAGRRPFGKGTLIYPALIMTDYLKYREGRNINQMHASPTVGTLEELDFLSFTKNADFCTIGPAGGGHAMLAYGNPEIVESVREAVHGLGKRKRAEKSRVPAAKSVPVSIPQTPLSFSVRTKKRLLKLYRILGATDR